MKRQGEDRKPAECDPLCHKRKCFHPGEDKGTFCQGRGYTSYHAKPIPACMTRLLHGCPYENDTRVWPDWVSDIAELRAKIAEAKCSARVRKLLSEILCRYAYAVQTMGKNVKHLEKKLQERG